MRHPVQIFVDQSIEKRMLGQSIDSVEDGFAICALGYSRGIDAT
jgi:hypothetical protein